MIDYKQKAKLLLLCFVLVLSSFGLASAKPFKDKEIKETYLIKFKAVPDLNTRVKIRKLLDGNLTKVIKTPVGSFVEIDGVSLSQNEAREKLKSLKGFLRIEKVVFKKLAYIPNDPLVSNQWNLLDIRAFDAWNIDDGKNNPVIAVVDSGADLDHPELKNRLWINSDEVPDNFKDDDSNGYVDDIYGYSFTGVSQLKVTYHTPVGDYRGTKVAQTFYSKGEKIESLGLKFLKKGYPQLPVIVEIYEGLPGQFGAKVASTQIPPQAVVNLAEVKAVFNPPVTLKKDKIYSFVISTFQPDYSNYYMIFDVNYSASTEDLFLRGNEWVYSYGSWQSYHSDIYFKIYPENQKPYDDEGHGTAVSSIAAAETNNLLGIAGICPKARLMILKVSAGEYISSTDMIEAIYYAANNGAHVINLSLSGKNSSLSEQEAINYAAQKGVLIVAAAGNDGEDGIFYPAGYENVIAVSSYDERRQLSEFSNYGSFIDLSAPGESIPSVNLDYFSNPKFALFFGTSMSAPHVAAAGALSFSLQPELIGFTVSRSMFATAEDIYPSGKDSYYGYGAINLKNLLEFLKTPEIKRTYGSDRIKTSIEIARKYFSTQTVDSVVLATADNFPDSLSGAPLAAVLEAPVLLTKKDYLRSDVAGAISFFKPKKVYLLGGTGAISLKVEEEVRKIAGIEEVERINGADRYETAVKIAEKIIQISGNKGQVFIATGESFPDALSSSPLASFLGVPVILVKKDNIPYSVLEFIKKSGFNSAYLVGGTGVISSAVENALKTYIPTVARYGGTDRYDTNRLLMELAINDFGFSKKDIFVATGENYPDALSIGSVSGTRKKPLVLVKNSYYLKEGTLSLINGFGEVSTIEVIGGPGAVGKGAVSRVFEETKF